MDVTVVRQRLEEICGELDRSITVLKGAGGQVQLKEIAVNAGGAFVGQVFFTGSPCAMWANFSGRIIGDTATLSMYVGNCGLDEVTLHRQGNIWVGTYRAQYPDEGTVTMVP